MNLFQQRDLLAGSRTCARKLLLATTFIIGLICPTVTAMTGSASTNSAHNSSSAANTTTAATNASSTSNGPTRETAQATMSVLESKSATETKASNDTKECKAAVTFKAHNQKIIKIAYASTINSLVTQDASGCLKVWDWEHLLMPSTNKDDYVTLRNSDRPFTIIKNCAIVLYNRKGSFDFLPDVDTKLPQNAVFLNCQLNIPNAYNLIGLPNYLIADFRTGTCLILNAHTFERVGTIEQKEPGQWIALDDERIAIYQPKERRINIVDVTTGHLCRQIQLNSSTHLHKDQPFIALPNRRLAVWWATDTDHTHITMLDWAQKIQNHRVITLSALPSNIIALGKNDLAMHIATAKEHFLLAIDTTNGRLKEICQTTMPITCIACTPTGSHLIASFGDGTINIYDLTNQ